MNEKDIKKGLKLLPTIKVKTAEESKSLYVQLDNILAKERKFVAVQCCEVHSDKKLPYFQVHFTKVQ